MGYKRESFVWSRKCLLEVQINFDLNVACNVLCALFGVSRNEYIFWNLISQIIPWAWIVNTGRPIFLVTKSCGHIGRLIFLVTKSCGHIGRLIFLVTKSCGHIGRQIFLVTKSCGHIGRQIFSVTKSCGHWYRFSRWLNHVDMVWHAVLSLHGNY